MSIRNIAIIAHVDHGKTTLVDAMLKQTNTFRNNQKEMEQSLIMDSHSLEREKGITILAKNTSVFYSDSKINIIDTPGHADFGGEVERTINMASGAILLVDAVEGPLPQTKFVLKKALEAHLKIILIINKIDKKESRADKVIQEVENLFLDLARDEYALNFTTLYAVGRDGKVFYQLPQPYTIDIPGNLTPLFDTIIREIPDACVVKDNPFQMMISALDYDQYVGKLSIGKVTSGICTKNQLVTLIDENKILGTYKAQKLHTFEGLEKKEVDKVISGDIVAIAGIPEFTIGQTLTDPTHPASLPKIHVEEPTIKITIGPNTSPLAGCEGFLGSSKQIKERLLKEKETNLGLKIETNPDLIHDSIEGIGINAEGGNFTVHGRGELHLSILIETMRREGFELQVSRPHIIEKKIDGNIHEPYEEVTIQSNKEFVGQITKEFGKRKGELIDVKTENNTVTATYKISESNLLGIRSILLTKTRGTALFNTYFLGYFPRAAHVAQLRNGVLIATHNGTSLSYGLVNAQERGHLFIGPGETVYGGMIVGVASRAIDVSLNVCKGKKLTNNRSSGEGVSTTLTPPMKLSLEQALDFIDDDELLEVTPKNLRIRKKILSFSLRKANNRNQ